MRRTLLALFMLTVFFFFTELRPLSYGLLFVTVLYLIDRWNERITGKKYITIKREKTTPPQ